MQQVFDEYQANEARANNTYKNRPLNVNFRVDEVEDTYVIQRLGFIDEAQLRFHQEQLVTFDIGDRASATCELDGFDFDTWLKFDCR